MSLVPYIVNLDAIDGHFVVLASGNTNRTAGKEGLTVIQLLLVEPKKKAPF